LIGGVCAAAGNETSSAAAQTAPRRITGPENIIALCQHCTWPRAPFARSRDAHDHAQNQ
jgi:hypothetical protein